MRQTILDFFGEKEVETTERERILIGTDIRRVKRGMGCQKCNNTGYRGEYETFFL